MEIKVRKIHDNLNGTVTAEFDVSDELMKWFCDQHNLKEFDEDLFHEWFMNSLKKAAEEVVNNEISTESSPE